jgi:hypothetical protein
MKNKELHDGNSLGCQETFARLDIIGEILDPNEVSLLLSISPSEMEFKNDLPEVYEDHQPYSGWFLSSEGILDSKDSRHHLDWILELISDKKDEFAELHNLGYSVNISVIWVSYDGCGGPTITPHEMAILSDLKIELWFNFISGLFPE